MASVPSEWTAQSPTLAPLLPPDRWVPRGPILTSPSSQGHSPCPMEDSEANGPSFHPELPVGARPCLTPHPRPQPGEVPHPGCVPVPHRLQARRARASERSLSSLLGTEPGELALPSPAGLKGARWLLPAGCRSPSGGVGPAEPLSGRGASVLWLGITLLCVR